MSWRCALRWWGALASVTLLAVAMACATRPDESVDRDPASVTLTGYPELTGSLPVDRQVVLHDGKGGSTRLHGDMAERFASITGALVEVWGVPVPEQNAVRVEGFRLISVDGLPALLGTVKRAEGGRVYLHVGDTLVTELTGGVAAFRNGETVWVQGDPVLRVQRYGIVP